MTFLALLAIKISWFSISKELNHLKFLNNLNYAKYSNRIVINLKTKSKNDLIEHLILVDKIVSKKLNLVGFSFDKNDDRRNKIIIRKDEPILEDNYFRTGYKSHNWIEYAKGYKYGSISTKEYSKTIYYTNVSTMHRYKK